MKKSTRLGVMEWCHNLCIYVSSHVSKLLPSTVLPWKTLLWKYNERHHGKGHMGGIGRTVKNVILRKVKPCQLVVYSPLEFSEVMYTPYTYLEKNVFSSQKT